MRQPKKLRLRRLFANGGLALMVMLAMLVMAAASNSTAAQAVEHEALQVSVRREGFVPFLPQAYYRIAIKVPEAKLFAGWRCCWIEAYSRSTAAAISQQEQKPVAGNDSGVFLDAARTEGSLREVAPGMFVGRLWLSAAQGWGNHAARFYVHLYQTPPGGESRVASDFLVDPFITTHFTYTPLQTPGPVLRDNTVPGAPPSQLPHY